VTTGPILLALDVDGTVLRFDGTVSPDVRAALEQVRDAGAHIVLASGRSVAALIPVTVDLGLTSGYAVCSNGAVTCELDPSVAGDPRAGPVLPGEASDTGAMWNGGGYRLVEVVTFDPGPVLRVLAAELPDALIAVEDIGVGSRVSAPFPAGELAGEHMVVSFDELASRPATRVVLRDPGSTAEEFGEVVARVGLHEVSYAIGWSAWMDLTPGGVSKASALDKVRQRLGVDPSATVAVGDGGNDVEMLAWAARGVAMGHAVASVRDAADEVTGGIDDDGLVPVLRSLL